MKYVVDHIPKSTPYNRRPGIPMVPTTITIHNTGNPSSTARNERNWLTNPSNTRTASFHIVVDEREAIECIPINEVAWHAGDGGNGPGNRTSIGIEICESGNYTKTLENAAELVAKMLHDFGWGVDRLRRHYDWSGKICPRLMYDGGKWTGWTKFVKMVQEKQEVVQMSEVKKQGPFKDVPADFWAAKEIEAVRAAGLMSGRPDGTFGPNEPVTRAQLAVILAKLMKK